MARSNSPIFRQTFLVQHYLQLVFILAGVVIPGSLLWSQITNATTIVYRTATSYRGGTDTLHVRWWKPTNVTSPLPLIVWIHGGAFYAGNYADMTPECERWAAKGFCSVTVQYRLGFWSQPFLDPPYTYDQTEIVRACWRAMQDVRFAIRELASGRLIQGLDTNCIILAGESAGAIAGMQAVIADGADSVPAEVDSTSRVVRGLDSWARPSLGNADGYPLHSKVAYRPMPRICGILNRFGALLHPYMLDASVFPAIFSYHQRNDLIVPCETNRALYGLPLGVGDKWPVITGSCGIERLLAAGNQPAKNRETMIVDGFTHGLHDVGLVRAHEDAFVATVACNYPTSVIEVQPDVTGELQWQAFDVLGRYVAGGTAARQDIANAVQVLLQRECRLLLLRVGTEHRILHP